MWPGVRHAAMNALASVRGQEAHTFVALAKFVRVDGDRIAAIRALQKIPRSFWPTDDARPLLDVVIADIKETPTSERTAPATLDELEFADALASLLPADTADSISRKSGLFSAQKFASASSLSKIGTSSHFAIGRMNSFHFRREVGCGLFSRSPRSSSHSAVTSPAE